MIFNWIRKKRIKWAFKMGKQEHKFGRLIAIPICLSMSWAWFNKDNINFILTSTTLAFWIVYIGSHTLEKKLFGKNGPRSGWGKK